MSLKICLSPDIFWDNKFNKTGDKRKVCVTTKHRHTHTKKRNTKKRKQKTN